MQLALTHVSATYVNGVCGAGCGFDCCLCLPLSSQFFFIASSTRIPHWPNSHHVLRHNHDLCTVCLKAVLSSVVTCTKRNDAFYQQQYLGLYVSNEKNRSLVLFPFTYELSLTLFLCKCHFLISVRMRCDHWFFYDCVCENCGCVQLHVSCWFKVKHVLFYRYGSLWEFWCLYFWTFNQPISHRISFLLF